MCYWKKKKKCIQKEDGEFIAHSESGWVTPSVLISYLRWLKKKKVGKENFAIVLDVYKIHVVAAVKRETAKIGIQLIFVPACETGLLQQLDRWIFDVLKKKLEKNGHNKTESEDKLRWKNWKFSEFGRI